MRLIKVIFACGLLAMLACGEFEGADVGDAGSCRSAGKRRFCTAGGSRAGSSGSSGEAIGSAGRAGAVHGFGHAAGDEFDGLHVDCGGADFCHRACDDVEVQGNPDRRTKCDGNTGRRLGKFDGRRPGAQGRRAGFSRSRRRFSFSSSSRICGFDSGRGQHRRQHAGHNTCRSP